MILKYARYTAGVLLALSLGYLIISKADLRSVLTTISGVNPRIILYCSAVYLSAHMFRALRFSALLGNESPSLKILFPVVAMHNLLNQLMPMKTGEASYVFLVKKSGGINYSKGIASLFLARVYDLAAIVLLFLLFALIEIKNLEWFSPIYVVLGVVLVLTVLYILRKIDKIFMRFGSRGRFGAILNDVVAISANSSIASLLLYSIGVWLSTFFMFYIFISGIDGSIGFFKASLASSGAVIANMLPINSPGSVGTLEAGWTIGYMLAGVSREDALASGILMHAFVIGYGSVLALAGLIFLRLSRGSDG